MCNLSKSVVLAAVAMVSPTLTGCATYPPMQMQAQRYRIEVRLDPAQHAIRGWAALDLVRVDDGSFDPNQPATVALLLHPDLKITQVRGAGAHTRSYTALRASTKSASEHSNVGRRDRVGGVDDGFAPRRYAVVVDRPVEAMTLFVAYEGKLFQDVVAGEKPGQIHNFSMHAHIGEEGIYLADGYWYPQPARDDETTPPPADFTLLTDRVAEMELVASGETDSALSEQTDRLAWRSPYPLTEMVLVGGPHEVHRASYRGIEIAVHLKPSQGEQAAGLIEAVKRNLDRYEPLIGAFPARQYSIVDNFFSSGFAFPCFTLLSSAVIDMGSRSQTTHGYLDHEFLHSWWGNGVHVDPHDGNWCEALASYGANYYGFMLDGKETEARRKRRNYSHFLSRLKAEDDRPLGTFSQKDGCNRQIAYDKGAMVFHMLARKMGQDNFWAAMRKFNEQYAGRYASWEDIRRVCEEQSGTDLARFFQQWVRGSGAPKLGIDHAVYRTADRTLTFTLSEGDLPFAIDPPVRLHGPSGAADLTVSLDQPSVEHTMPVDSPPHTIEVDPDYQLFRRIDPADIIPTTASTRTGSAFTCVLPPGEPAEQYRKIADNFESSFSAEERIERTPQDLRADADLAERSALILGEAVRDPAVEAFLSAIEFPVRWIDGGFEFEENEYDDPGDAVLCTMRHPGVSGGGVTVVFANSESAIPQARLISFYEHSLVIFRDGMPVLRQDFEPSQAVRVERF
ncbi:MAG: M1 family aminopeptidase [Phycisphaerales bacterium]|nr:M1 family aminopeptidase [Phycisphaerales bacterium]